MKGPAFICANCGMQHGRKSDPSAMATWHTGFCDICRRREWVTDPRDFGGLKEGWACSISEGA